LTPAAKEHFCLKTADVNTLSMAFCRMRLYQYYAKAIFLKFLKHIKGKGNVVTVPKLHAMKAYKGLE
jgi:hypothetical protein